jgi:hypothetical protein
MEPKPAIRVPTRFGAETAAQRDQNHVTSMTCRIRPGQISPKYAQRPQTQAWRAHPKDIIAAVKRGHQTLQTIH